MISEIIQYIDYCIHVYIDIYASKASAVVLYTAIVEPGTTFTIPKVIQALIVIITILLNYQTCTCSKRTARQIYRDTYVYVRNCILSNQFLTFCPV